MARFLLTSRNYRNIRHSQGMPGIRSFESTEESAQKQQQPHFSQIHIHIRTNQAERTSRETANDHLHPFEARSLLNRVSLRPKHSTENAPLPVEGRTNKSHTKQCHVQINGVTTPRKVLVGCAQTTDERDCGSTASRLAARLSNSIFPQPIPAQPQPLSPTTHPRRTQAHPLHPPCAAEA